MKLFALTSLYIVSFVLGGLFLVSALGSFWFAEGMAVIIAWALMGCAASAIIAAIATSLRKTNDILSGLIFSLPTSFFAIASLGSLREEPAAFLTWATLSGLMWISSIGGGLASKSFLQ